MLKVENWKIDKLIPYARNPRRNDAQVDRMVSAIKKFGFRIPVVAKSDGSVVDGHLRLKAAQKLGLKEVPVALADELTEAQVKAFRLLANKSANWAEWDDELLRLELDELKGMDFDLSLTGFDSIELDDVFASAAVGTEGLTDADDVPEVKETPVTKEGDIWLLGKHRLMCGDSTACIDEVMNGGEADLVLTDPPYGVKRDKGFGGVGYLHGKPIPRRKYNDDWDSETPSKDCFDEILASATNSIIFGGNFFTDKLPCSGFWLVWDKHNTMPTFGDCELAWTNIPRQSVKKYDVVVNGCFSKENGDKRFHPTQKPVALFETIINDFTKEGAVVLDFFGGSGTTLIACEKTGRVCRMMELSPHYCDVIVKRWQDFTGQKATLESNGRTFDEVANV